MVAIEHQQQKSNKIATTTTTTTQTTNINTTPAVNATNTTETEVTVTVKEKENVKVQIITPENEIVDYDLLNKKTKIARTAAAGNEENKENEESIEEHKKALAEAAAVNVNEVQAREQNEVTKQVTAAPAANKPNAAIEAPFRQNINNNNNSNSSDASSNASSYKNNNNNNNNNISSSSSKTNNNINKTKNNNNNNKSIMSQTSKPNSATSAAAVSTKSAVSQRNIDIKIDKKSNIDATTQQLTKKVLKLDLTGKDIDEYSIKSPKSPITARLPHQTSLTSSVDVEDRKTLREALYQGIFHRHRRTIFAVGSFLRMLRSRNSQYNTIRSSSEGEDIDEVR